MDNEYLIKDLFEKAKMDPSWDEDPKEREMLADALYENIMFSLS